MSPKMAEEERIKFQLEKEDSNEGNIEESAVVVNFEGGTEGSDEEEEEEDYIIKDDRNISNSSIEAPSNVDCYPSALNTLVADNEADNSRHYCQFGNYTRYLVSLKKFDSRSPEKRIP